MFHPPELERSRERNQFDPLREGERYGLSRELSLALWERVCVDTTDAFGRRNEEQARERFHELAACIAARGGRLRTDPGRLTRVETELLGVAAKPTVAEYLAVRSPGRDTRVEQDLRRWAEIDRAAGIEPEIAGQPSELPGASDVAQTMTALQVPAAAAPSAAASPVDEVVWLRPAAEPARPREPVVLSVAAAAAQRVQRIAADAGLGAAATTQPLSRMSMLFGGAARATRHEAPPARLAARAQVGQAQDAAREFLEQVLAIVAHSAPGVPLPGELAARMKAELGGQVAAAGQAVEQVRVHTDGAAAEAAQLLGAQAFTVGQHVYVARGQFAPGTDQGDRLLRHELTHVAQHVRGELAAHGQLELVAESSATEAEAREAEARPTQPSFRSRSPQPNVTSLTGAATDHGHDVERSLLRGVPFAAEMTRASGPAEQGSATAGAGGGQVVQRAPTVAGDAQPDYKKEWNSLTFKNAIEGGFEGFKRIRGALIAKFGTLAQANTYYKGVGSSPFLGRSPMVHKASLGAKLAATDKLLKAKGWYDAIVAGSPSVGGFNIRANRNNAKVLSDHSFGWAIDIDAALNPNVKKFPEGVVRGLTGQGMFTGEANAKVAGGGTAKELLPWVQKMKDASDAFKAAFVDENSLKKAMLDYLTGKLGMTIAAKDLDLATVKGAKASGNKAQKKQFQQLVDTLAGAHPNLAKALAEQLDEERDAYVHKHGWKAWQAELAKRAAAKQKADKKHEKQLADKWKKEGKEPTQQDIADEAAKVTAGVEREVAKRAASFLVQMYDIYRQSFANMKKGTRAPAQVAGSAGSIAAHGFINLKPELIAALTGSDGGNLKWLGNATGTKDFMHFELKAADRPPLQ